MKTLNLTVSDKAAEKLEQYQQQLAKEKGRKVIQNEAMNELLEGLEVDDLDGQNED